MTNKTKVSKKDITNYGIDVDEAPKAYKNIFEVMDAQKDSVKVIKHIKPIMNWKG